MKAYTKNIKRLKQLKKRFAFSRTLQYALLGLLATGYTHAQHIDPKPAKSEKKENRDVPTVIDAQENGARTAKSGEEAVLPTVVIKDKGGSPGYVTKSSTTATKTVTPIIEIPQSISVITREELDMRGVQNFTEALRYVPGVVVDQFGFEGRGFEYLNMRGFTGLTTANFRDGLSQAAQGLRFGSFITDPYALERIDVLRGPSSVMFGRGDAGGIVNRITKRPNANPIRELEIQYGNFDRKRVAADVGLANADGTLMFRLVTTALDTDTQLKYANTNGDRAEVRRFYIAPSLTWRPTAATTITLLGDILNNRTNASPFYLTTPDESATTNVLLGDPKFTKYATNQASFSYQLEHHFNETWTARQNFRFMRQDGRFRDFNPVGYRDDGRTFDRMALTTNERLDQTVLDNHLEARLRTGRLNHTVLAGIDWNRTDATAKLFLNTDTTPPLDILNPVYPQPVPTPDFLFVNARQKIDQVGFYIQDQIKFDQKWILTLSGRHDRVSTNTTDSVAIIIPPETLTKNAAYTGRAGLTYLFSNGLAPYVSYSQSFLPQSGFDTNFQPFDPTRASQYEVGIKYQPVGRKSLYTLAFFDLTKSNVLTPDPNNILRLVQTGEVRSRGVEVEARGELYRGLNVIGAFTYNDVKVTESNGINLNRVPTLVPALTSSGWLDYSLDALGVSWLRGFGIGGGARYVSRIFDDEENTRTTPSFTLFDAVLRYDHGPWRFFINANNIFNEKYFANQNFRGMERTVIGTLKLRF